MLCMLVSLLDSVHLVPCNSVGHTSTTCRGELFVDPPPPPHPTDAFSPQMDKGKCVELASPAELLAIEGGHFAAMVDALGKEAAQLRKMAKKAAAASAAKKKNE
jgi:hypothetical protein